MSAVLRPQVAEIGWLVRYRTGLYAALNLTVLLVGLFGAQINDLPLGLAIYTVALLALCSAPLLFLTRINDRYALLGIFMLCYFMCFGALNLQMLLVGTDLPQSYRDGLLSRAELLILSGAVCALVSYRLIAVWNPGYRNQRAAAEWPAHSILVVGLGLWVLGMAASFYYQIYIVPSKLGYAAFRGLANAGQVLMFFLMLGQMVATVGALILAYGYSKYGGVSWTGLIVFVVATQVVVGFIEDIKAQAIMAPALVVLTRGLVTNRLSKGWIAFLLAFLVVAFPIFQAYRTITAEYGMDRAQALAHLDRMLERAVSASDKESTPSRRTQSFLERSFVKGNIEILVERVGNDVPYLGGSSLTAIPYAFVPRLLMPDKDAFSVGELFGRVMFKADSGVYISISHLGELYWNFGWSGVILGMSAIGLLLGFVGARFSLERGVTLTRVLVLVVTAQALCVGFEGTMPVSYVLWLRGMAAVMLMNLCFARRVTDAPTVVTPTLANALALSESVPRFPNLLR